MKNILLCLMALCFVANASAQIEVQKSFKNSLIIIGNLSSGAVFNALSDQGKRLAEHKLYCRVFKDKTTYGILVDTENRFDDDLEFALGSDIEKACKSINDILSIMNDSDLNTSYTIKDEDDRIIQLNLKTRKGIHLKAIDAKGDVIVDDVFLTKSNLERALMLLEKKAESVVNKELARQKE